MKYFLTTALILSSFLGYSQSPAESRIRSFLSDLKSESWTFEKIYDDHMQFEIDSMRFNKDVKTANFNTMTGMAKSLTTHHLDVSKLIIELENKPKQDAEAVLPSKEYSPNSLPFTYLVYDSDKKVIWYFLLTKESRIRSILRFKDNKMFLVY